MTLTIANSKDFSLRFALSEDSKSFAEQDDGVDFAAFGAADEAEFFGGCGFD